MSFRFLKKVLKKLFYKDRLECVKGKKKHYALEGDKEVGKITYSVAGEGFSL